MAGEFRVFLSRLVLVGICAAALSAAPAAAQPLADGEGGTVSYESYGGDVTLTAEIELPDTVTGQHPGMILVHGSGGIGYREATWGAFFRDNGYVTMVIDMFGPRDFTAMSGPNVGGYDDVFDAFNVLRTHPNVDPDRISVMGWSWGGGIALSAASHTPRRGGGHVLKSMVSFYPVCGVSAVPALGNTDAELLLVVGTKDTYTKDWQCKEVVDKAQRDGRKARLIVYPGAWHGFDNNKNVTFTHGKFGTQTIRADYDLAERSRADVLAFLEAVGTDDGVKLTGAAESGGAASSRPDACETQAYADLFPDVCG